MNSSFVFVNITPSHTSKGMQMNEITRTLISAAALGVFAVLIHVLSSPPKITQIRKHLRPLISTPSKLFMFIFFGQIPLHYYGVLRCISLTDIVGVAGFGGFGLSILYALQERFNSSPTQSFETSAIDCQSRHRHDSREKIKLDWALQGKVTLLFVCEIYHTVAGVIMGVLAMRLFELSSIDQAYFDLLLFSGFLGPMVFFSWFVLMAGVVFGILWVVRSH